MAFITSFSISFHRATLTLSPPAAAAAAAFPPADFLLKRCLSVSCTSSSLIMLSTRSSDPSLSSSSSRCCGSTCFSHAFRSTSDARSSDGASGMLTFALGLPFSTPLYTERYSATADLASFVSDLARSSHTQQCTPRRPEYTHSRCLNPKSSRSAASSTLTATCMKVQHL